MNETLKAILASSLTQVKRIDNLNEALHEFLKDHPELTKNEDENLVRILISLKEIQDHQVKQSQIIGSMIKK